MTKKEYVGKYSHSFLPANRKLNREYLLYKIHLFVYRLEKFYYLCIISAPYIADLYLTNEVVDTNATKPKIIFPYCNSR